MPFTTTQSNTMADFPRDYPGYQTVLDFIKWKRIPEASTLTPYEYIVRVWKGKELAANYSPTTKEQVTATKDYWDKAILNRDNLDIHQDWFDYTNGKRDLHNPYANYRGKDPVAAEAEDELDRLQKQVDEKLRLLEEEGPPALALLGDEPNSGSSTGSTGSWIDLAKSKAQGKVADALLAKAKKAAMLNPEMYVASKLLAHNKGSTDALKASLLTRAKKAGLISAEPTLGIPEFYKWPTYAQKYALRAYNLDHSMRGVRQFKHQWDNEPDKRLDTLKELLEQMPRVKSEGYFVNPGDDTKVEKWLNTYMNFFRKNTEL